MGHWCPSKLLDEFSVEKRGWHFSATRLLPLLLIISPPPLLLLLLQPLRNDEEILLCMHVAWNF